jgi:hypothetical protein
MGKTKAEQQRMTVNHPRTAQGVLYMRDFNPLRKTRPLDDNCEPRDAEVIDINRAAVAAAKREAKKTFTSEKLSWVNLLMMDHEQQPVARLVGIAIAQTVNEETGVSKTSDRVIADRLGISDRTVIRSRLALRDGEYLAWHKPNPRAANRTKLVLSEKNIRRVEGEQINRKDRRDFEASEPRTRCQKS